MKYRVIIFFSIGLWLAIVASVWAQTAKPQKPAADSSKAKTEADGTFDLYGAAAPEDAACVRVVNAIPHSESLKIELGSTRFKAINFAGISPYRPVRPDIYQMRVNDMEKEIIASIGKYYTLIYTPTAIILFNDPAHTDPARAQLFLYNLSAYWMFDLKTADGQIMVIDQVAPLDCKEVKVNAVPVEFGIFEGDVLVQQLAELKLSRGQSYSIFIMDDGEELIIFTQQAVIDAD